MYMKITERAPSRRISDVLEFDLGPRMGFEHHSPVVDELAGHHGVLAQLRKLGSRLLTRDRGDVRPRRRPSAAALLSPADPGVFSLWERRAVAAFASILTGNVHQAKYVGLLADSHNDTGERVGDLSQAVLAEAHRLASTMPLDRYRVGDRLRERLNDRVAAALEHVWQILHGLSGTGASRQCLSRAGWSEDDIVSLEHVVSLFSPMSVIRH